MAAVGLSSSITNNPARFQVSSLKAFKSLSTSKFFFRKTHFPPCISLATSKFKKQKLVQLCGSSPTVSTPTTHYEFHDEKSEVELRLELGDENLSPDQILVDARENSLVIKVENSGYVKTLLDTNNLYGTIKPSETIWFVDDAQLVVNLKKQDSELKWPDIMESWESLSEGVLQLLKGTSIFLVGESTEINEKISRELAVGLGYTPLSTKELLEAYTKQSIDSWVKSEGSDSVAETEAVILESLSGQARAVVATLGGENGAARKPNKWQHLFAGFTVWLSLSEAADEETAREEAKRDFKDDVLRRGYSKAEVVVKLGGWDPIYAKSAAQATLSALKRSILSDKDLPGKKSLYIRLGCRGDWPAIKPLLRNGQRNEIGNDCED